MPELVHSCGAKLKFPAGMEGRRGKCPTCGQPIIVPTSSGAVPTVSISSGTLPALGDSGPRAGLAPRANLSPVNERVALDPPAHWEQYLAYLEDRGPNPRPTIMPANLMLKTEAEAKWEAQERKAPPSKFHCPGCKTRLDVGAVVCLSCGLDLRTGKSVDGKTKLNEAGREYLSKIPWLQVDEFDPTKDEDDKSDDKDDEDGGKKKPRFPNLRKPRRPT